MAHLHVVEEHSYESASGDDRVYAPECAVGHALFDVTAQQISGLAHCRAEEDVGKIVAFEGAEKEEPHKRLVTVVKLQHLERERAEESAVVFPQLGGAQVGGHALGALADFLIE